MESRYPSNKPERNLRAGILAPMWRGVEHVLLEKRWRVPAILAAEVFTWLRALVIHISTTSPYFFDNSKPCLDCQVPHASVPLKYAFKAMGGTRHAFMLTFHMEPESILGAVNYLPFTKTSVHAYKQL